MTEAPQYRIFLDKEKAGDIDLSRFSNGIPCSDFLALDYNNMLPKNFVFLVDKEKLHLTDNYCLYNEYGNSCIVTMEQGEMQVCPIPIEAVESVIDFNGIKLPLDLMKQSWIISNHVRKLPEIITPINGETAQTILLGLQQALLVNTPSRSDLNKLFFNMAIEMIKQLSLENPTLKEYFLMSFPDDYMEEARERLLS